MKTINIKEGPCYSFIQKPVFFGLWYRFQQIEKHEMNEWVLQEELQSKYGGKIKKFYYTTCKKCGEPFVKVLESE